jgi:hypothetical protein
MRAFSGGLIEPSRAVTPYIFTAHFSVFGLRANLRTEATRVLLGRVDLLRHQSSQARRLSNLRGKDSAAGVVRRCLAKVAGEGPADIGHIAIVTG